MSTWKDLLKKGNLDLVLFDVSRQVDELYIKNTCYPLKRNIVRCFTETPLDQVKVVLIGQDPYINDYKGKPSACGLAFATENGYMNPSLRFIFKELEASGYANTDGSSYKPEQLVNWTKEGVLLLNRSLTVEKGKSNSHKDLWEKFTLPLVEILSIHNPNIIWLLLGNDAKQLTNNIQHGHIVTAPHPMAEGWSGGKIKFVGTNCFKHVNELLIKMGKKPIKWNL